MEAKSTNFISLREAASLCDSSQDYLSLISRKGYLKATKFGRNWVTKKKWLADYLKRVGEKKDYCVAVADLPCAKSAIILPPKPPRAVNSAKSKKLPIGIMLTICIFAIATVVAPIAGFEFKNKNYPAALSQAISPVIVFFEEIKETVSVFGQKFSTFADYVIYGKTEVVSVMQTASVDKTALTENIDILGKNIIDDVYQRINQFKKESGLPVLDESISESASALIVAPASENARENESVKEKIKENFSDEITVVEQDKSSGIIIPRFRDGPGDEYIYMIVPMSQ